MKQGVLQEKGHTRLLTLNGIRIVFALLVYISHCSTPNIATPFDFGGECGVAFFFSLSGFVLSWGGGEI